MILYAGAISSSTEEGLTSRVHLRGEAVPDGIHTRFDEATGATCVWLLQGVLKLKLE